MSIKIRKAIEADLQAVLEPYAQKDIDIGDVLGMEDAKVAFNKFGLYPNYSLLHFRVTLAFCPPTLKNFGQHRFSCIHQTLINFFQVL